MRRDLVAETYVLGSDRLMTTLMFQRPTDSIIDNYF